jgi:hypothetical protein
MRVLQKWIDKQKLHMRGITKTQTQNLHRMKLTFKKNNITYKAIGYFLEI